MLRARIAQELVHQAFETPTHAFLAAPIRMSLPCCKHDGAYLIISDSLLSQLVLESDRLKKAVCPEKRSEKP